MMSQVTDIEHLSKTKTTYDGELSFAGLGLKLNSKEDAKEICEKITAKTDLRVLRLEGNTISPQAAEEIGKALKEKKSLQRFIGNDLFTGRLKDEIPLALKSMCGAMDISGANLVEINMSDNAFGPIGLDALIEFFQAGCCHTLQELRLHNNGLGPQGAQKLAHSLEQGWRKSGEKMSLKVFVCGRNRLEYEGAKSISNTLKLMGTLEEIQMPQNGIRPNAIEFVADACSNNPNLRTINMNDNTLRSVGAEWMAKALSKLKNLEYINFGDCLLKSKGALVLTRALVQSPNIKEIVLSFNEISLESGVELSKLIASKMRMLELLDLNGNKFGVDGVIDVMKILEPVKSAVGPMSEDEGEDDEEEEDSDGDQDSGDEDEDALDEEGYENIDDYEDYDEEEDEDEEDEDYEYEGCDNEVNEKNRVSNLTQESNLFKPFINQAVIKPSNTFAANNKPNLFTSMVVQKLLKTNTVSAFDSFIASPDINSLQGLDDVVLRTVADLEQFDAKFLVLFISVLAKVYDEKSKIMVSKCAGILIGEFFKKNNNLTDFSNEFLTQFGFLKSEEKNFRPIEISEALAQLLEEISKSNYIPRIVIDKVLNYVKLRNDMPNENSLDQKYKTNSKLLLKCFS